MLVRCLEECKPDWINLPGTAMRSWVNEDIILTDSGHHFGYIASGTANLCTPIGKFPVPIGCYFSIAGECLLTGIGTGLLVTHFGYRGLFSIGGPIEGVGRLRYIDGCSDSVLVSPPRVGDPCLNMLYVPPHIDQTPHTHPSLRIGIIVSGQGCCKTPMGNEDMRPGDVFMLPKDLVHSFHTSSEPMRIVVYHPDSDCGPSDDVHPMVTRTLVDSKPASEIPSIRTTYIHSGI